MYLRLPGISKHDIDHVEPEWFGPRKLRINGNEARQFGNIDIYVKEPNHYLNQGWLVIN